MSVIMGGSLFGVIAELGCGGSINMLTLKGDRGNLMLNK